MVSKSQKPSAKHPQGGIVKQEAPIQVSKLNPVVDGKVVRSNGKARNVKVKN